MPYAYSPLLPMCVPARRYFLVRPQRPNRSEPASRGKRTSLRSSALPLLAACSGA
jgi:hypothetical protein